MAEKRRFYADFRIGLEVPKVSVLVTLLQPAQAVIEPKSRVHEKLGVITIGASLPARVSLILASIFRLGSARIK